jgi:hypothetical protein
MVICSIQFTVPKLPHLGRKETSLIQPDFPAHVERSTTLTFWDDTQATSELGNTAISSCSPAATRRAETRHGLNLSPVQRAPAARGS